MTATVTSHVKLDDGSYELTVTDDQGTEYDFAYGPLDPDATLYEDGPPLTENDYVQQQRDESTALVEANAAAAAGPQIAEDLL